MLRVAIRVVAVREQTLAPQTLTPHRGITCLCTNIHIKATEGKSILRPDLSLSKVCVVVIAVLVTLLHYAGMTVGIVVLYIVLVGDNITALISLGKLVNIEPIVTTEKVLNGAIVLCTVYASL